ncbi:MAG: ferric reductase-like transmembrane domain-containing protein, partial [Acidimicrobiales bacterium]
MPPARSSVLTRPAGAPPAAPPSADRPALATAVVVVAALGLLVVLGFTIADEPSGSLHARGGGIIFAGNITGMVGTYLVLLQVLLASRIAPVEHLLGLDGIIRWHRRLGPWPISLLTVHAVALIVGYAKTAKTGTMHEIGTLVGSYP